MLSVSLYNRRQHVQRVFETSPILIGRKPDAHTNVLEVEDPFVSSNQCLLGQSVAGELTLTNLGRSLVLSAGPRLHRGKSITVSLPFTMCIGDTQVQVFDPTTPHALDFSLQQLITAESNLSIDQIAPDPQFGEGNNPNQLAPEAATLASWFEALGVLNRSIPGSQEFFDVAARAIFNPGGMDSGLVLRKANDGWNVIANHIPYPDYGISFRPELVEMAMKSRTTVYHCANEIDTEQPFEDLHAAVVCPIFDSEKRPVAALYGTRSQHRVNNRRGVRILEAQFVRMIAEAVSTGLMRMESEADAARTRVLLEQAFSPKVAKEMETNPDILEGRDREVTVVFTDLRGFSTISERIGARKTYKLLTDVMDRFSHIIQKKDGVIIDFYGDGLSAFWNAPLDQPDHAQLGCEAALEIAQTMPELNKLWTAQLGQELRVGVGVHTGIAQVGNSGSSTRLKYGPQGNTVNIAARLENATKLIGAPIIISDATAKRLGNGIQTRKVCTLLLKGISSPTTLTEVLDSTHIRPPSALDDYAEALAHYEKGNFDDAIALFMKVQIESPMDRVNEFMLNAAVDKSKSRMETKAPLSLLTPLTEQEIVRQKMKGRVRPSTTLVQDIQVRDPSSIPNESAALHGAKIEVRKRPGSSPPTNI